MAMLSSGVLLLLQMVREAVRARSEVILLLLILPFLYLGCIAPTPTWYQYYFGLIPFIILGALYTVANLVETNLYDAASLLIGLCALVGFAFSAPGKNGSIVRGLMSPESWTPIRIERTAQKIATYLQSTQGHGAILTLSPLYAIPAGLPIFPEFVTGPFAWRVSYLLSDEDAVRRGLPLPARIKSFIKEKRPRAILTGQEEQQLETPLIKAAQELEYQPIRTGVGIVTWVFPAISRMPGEKLSFAPAFVP
jgi:hypothetical protein